MEQLGKNLGKYVITIVLVAFGLIFLVKYLSGDELESQPITMLIASLSLILVGVLAAPAVLSKFSKSVSTILMAVGLLLGAYLAWQVFYSIDEEIEFQEKKAEINSGVIQRLKDIRSAQEAYKQYNGTFTNNFDSLLKWIQEPVIAIPFRMGTFHDTLPEAKSTELGYVIKNAHVDSVATELGITSAQLIAQIDANETVYKILDTNYTSFYAENFTPEARQSKKLPPVDLEALPYSPYKGEKFIIKTGTVDNGGVERPTILVQDPTPFGREKVKKDTLRFGSLTEAITDGNWK